MPDPIVVTTPFGKDKMQLRSIQGEERISSLFRYSLELVSDDNSLDFTKIVGKSVTVTFTLSGGKEEYLNGIAGRFVQAGKDQRVTSYFVEVHPWLWLTTMNSDCQIFQNKTAPEIIKSVFDTLKFKQYKDSLKAQYKPREYCVQYMETSFQFVTRLMEEEGIFYFFQHDNGSHTLVLADDSSVWQPPTAHEKIHMLTGETPLEDEGSITACTIEQQVTAGQFKTDDYNFELPSTDLLATATTKETDRSLYEYPGGLTTKDPLEARAGRILAALEVPGKLLCGTSPCRSFRAGAKFTLEGHSRSDVNGAWVLQSVSFRGDPVRGYSNTFEAFPAATVYRPPRLAPKPRIPGAQTATVTGKSGEEIWTDKYGRITVKFHWDQAKPVDETSSCWVRVAQGWAGKQWGAFFLPRVGQEVIVSFLEGDPDRPIVTGSVYNATQTVPYALPDNQTRSTIKTNSSKGGGGFNEIRFEDKKGSEELFIQAQKDMTINVLNDCTSTIKNNRTTTIQEKDEALIVDKGNRSVKVNKGDETHEVKGKRDLTVTGAESHTNKADYKWDITGNLTLTVKGNLSIEAQGTVSVKGASITNEAKQAMTNKAMTLTNQGSVSQTVDGGPSLTLKGGMIQQN